MYWHNGMGLWAMGFLMLNVALFWALIAGVGFLIYRAIAQDSQRIRNHPTSSERILTERYARGEIDDEEYNRRLNTLRKLSPS